NLLKEALWPPRHTCNNSHELRSPLHGGATIRKTAIPTGAAWLGENSGGAVSSSLLCRTLRRHIRRQGDPRGGVTPPTLRWSAAEKSDRRSRQSQRRRIRKSPRTPGRQ